MYTVLSFEQMKTDNSTISLFHWLNYYFFLLYQYLVILFEFRKRPRLSKKCGNRATKQDTSMTPKRARDAPSGDAPSAKRRQQRRNGSTPLSNSSARLSTGDDDFARLQQETLRISNEMLRSEKEQLQVELEILEESNKKLEKKVATSQQRVQVLEGDLARWYRTQKRDAELKQAEHTAEVTKLQDQLDALLKHSGLAPYVCATDTAAEVPSKLSATGETVVPFVAAVSPKTAQEVDAFLATCMQWQANLTTASVNFEKQVSKIEENEVASVLSSVVAQVEIAAREDQVAEREHELEAMRLAMLQQQRKLERAMQKMKQERDEADAFEALERRILEDRVAELEVQLTQNRLREFEKDEEITNLRAEQDELSASSCVIPKTEWETHLAEHQRLGEESDEWRYKCESQTSEATRLQEELRAANSRLQEAEGRLQSVQVLEETRAFEVLEKRVLEERIEELEMQLQSQKQQPQIDDDVQAEQEQQRAKLAEDLEAAQLQLSVAEAESHVKKNEVARLLNDKAELKRQVKILATDLRKIMLQVEEYKAQVGAERQRSAQLAEEIKRLQDVNKESVVQQETSKVTDEQAKLLQEVRELKEQEQQLRVQYAAEKAVAVQRLERKEQELVNQMKHDEQASNEIAQLKQLNAQLLADQEHTSKCQAADDHSVATREEDGAHSPTMVESTGKLARLIHEKRAMQDFFRCYFETAEKKCRQLMYELSQREALSAYERQQAKDSCELLQKCAEQQQQQLEFCDSSVHQAILKAISTLERIS